MISASITAYSTAVGPSSETRKRRSLATNDLMFTPFGSAIPKEYQTQIRLPNKAYYTKTISFRANRDRFVHTCRSGRLATRPVTPPASKTGDGVLAVASNQWQDQTSKLRWGNKESGRGFLAFSFSGIDFRLALGILRFPGGYGTSGVQAIRSDRVQCLDNVNNPWKTRFVGGDWHLVVPLVFKYFIRLPQIVIDTRKSPMFLAFSAKLHQCVFTA